MSRNAREGYYLGRFQGRHTRGPRWLRIRYDYGVAWAEASRRAGEPLPVRRPRYLSKAVRAAMQALADQAQALDMGY
jgi:hypothetical protein